MRKEIFDEVIEINGKKLPINTANGKKSCYLEMLTAIEREMTAMLSNDRKVLMFRFDIHIKEYTPDNKVISDCLKEVKKFIKKNYEDCERIGYVWCREQQTVKHQHYHVFMMVNGSKSDNTFKISKRYQIERLYLLDLTLPRILTLWSIEVMTMPSMRHFIVRLI